MIFFPATNWWKTTPGPDIYSGDWESTQAAAEEELELFFEEVAFSQGTFPKALASLQHRHGWFTLLYLVPILWGSSRHGLRGGILAASSSGVVGVSSALASTLTSAEGVSSTRAPRSSSY